MERLERLPRPALISSHRFRRPRRRDSRGTDTRATFPAGEDEGLGNVMMDDYPPPLLDPQTTENKRLACSLGRTGQRFDLFFLRRPLIGLDVFPQQLLFILTSSQNLKKKTHQNIVSKDPGAKAHRSVPLGTHSGVCQREARADGSGGGSAPRESGVSKVPASLFLPLLPSQARGYTRSCLFTLLKQPGLIHIHQPLELLTLT